MKLTIIDARDCTVSVPGLARYKTVEYAHLNGDTAEELRNIGILTQEFGSRSRNYAMKNIDKEFSPEAFEACNQGTGRYPISSFVIPYRLDRATKEMVPFAPGSLRGGMFVLASDVDTIKSFLTDYFPALEIEDTRACASSYSM